MKVIRKQLSESEVTPVSIRYDEASDSVQQTPDDGDTWIDTPELDPRHGSGFRRPPLTGVDAKCNAAARELAAWREMYDIFQESTNALQFLAIVLNILLLLAGGVGVLISLILLLFDALIFIGKENMENAFTQEVWDGVMCIIYNHIGEDGQVSGAELDEIYAEIALQYPGVIYNTLIEIGHLFGEVLLSNASVERAEIGDCDECPTDWIYRWDFHANDGQFVFDSEAGNSAGVWVGGAGNGYQKGYTGIVCAQYDVSRKSVNFALSATQHITAITITLDAQSADQCSHIECYVGANRSEGLARALKIYQSTNGSTVTATGDITNTGTVHLTFQSGNSSGAGDFYMVTLNGTGTHPNFTGGQFI